MAKVILFNGKVVTHPSADGDVRPIVYNDTPYIILRFQNTDVVPPPLNETYVDMFSYEKIEDGKNTWKLKQTDENLTDWSNLLYNSLLLEDVGEVDILEINFANKITNATSLFQNDSGLHTIQNILNADSIENMTNAFSKSGLIELPDLILPNCDTIYVLCDGCQELTKAGNIHIGRGAGNFNYSVSYLFRNCSKLKSVGNIITENPCGKMSSMFGNCSTLETIGNLILPNVVDSTRWNNNIFKGCVGVCVGTIDLSNSNKGGSILSRGRGTVKKVGDVYFSNELTQIELNLIENPTIPDTLEEIGVIYGDGIKTITVIAAPVLEKFGGVHNLHCDMDLFNTSISASSIHNVITEALGGTDEQNIVISLNETSMQQWLQSIYHEQDALMCEAKHIQVEIKQTST